MKQRARMVLFGLVVVAAAVLWSAQQGRRPAWADGPCCPLVPGPSGVGGSSWAGTNLGNSNPGQTSGEAITNYQR